MFQEVLQLVCVRVDRDVVRYSIKKTCDFRARQVVRIPRVEKV